MSLVSNICSLQEVKHEQIGVPDSGVPEGLDEAEGGGDADVVHEEVGGGRPEAEAPVVAPLGQVVRRKKGDHWQVDQFEFKEAVV